MTAGTPEKIDLEPVGTGPFQLPAYQKDAVIRYKAHPDYWDGKAAIDNLVFAITPDASVRWQKLQASECQVMAYPNPADLEAMKQDPDVQVLSSRRPEHRLSRLQYREEAVRRRPGAPGAQLAVNKQAIIDAVFQGAGPPAKNPMPPPSGATTTRSRTTPTTLSGPSSCSQRPGSRSLDDQLWAMPVSRPYNPNARRMAELIQSDWQKSASTPRSSPSNGAST